jgi:hypothetical protein
MSRFYFSDKGITRKRNCPNLWPVRDRYFNRVPREVFNTPGNVPRAKIAIFDPEQVTFRAHHFEQGVEIMFGGCVMHAEYYNSGQTMINTVIQGREHKSREETDYDWSRRIACLPVLKQAVDLFVEYFPKQYL